MYSIDRFRAFCAQLPGVTEELPFGPDVLVFKVGGKMFALCGLYNEPVTANLKCDPARAVELREQWPQVAPGYHMNKQHWNTVTFDQRLPPNLIEEWTRDSWQLVFSSLPKKLQATIGGLKPQGA